MKLTSQALTQIRNKRTRAKLAFRLNVTDQSIVNYIEANKENGPLTTMAAVQIIQEDTGLDQSEILTEEVGEDHSVNGLGQQQRLSA